MVSVPLATVFILSSVLALLASSLIAWQLESYVNDNASLNTAVGSQYDSLVLTKASVELLRIKDFIATQLSEAVLAANEVRKFSVTFANDPRIRTLQGANDVINNSFFQAFAPRYATTGEIYGVALNFAYPLGTAAITSVQSFQAYADVLYGGNYQKLYSWTDPTSLRTLAIPIIETVEPGTGDSVVSLDVNNPAYDFDMVALTLPFINLTVGQSSLDLLPWQASDGNTWFFIQYTMGFTLRGVKIIPESFLSCAQWEQSMNSLLSTVGASYLVYDANYIPVATSVQAEVQRRTACLKNATDSAGSLACISATMPNHPTPFVRFLYSNFVVPLQNGTLPQVAGFRTDTARYARLQYGGLPVLVVSLSSTPLLPSQSLTSLWIANIGPTDTSSGGQAAVPILIVFIFVVSLVTTFGVGVLVRVTFLRPMDDLIGRMELVTELESDAIASAAVDRNMTMSFDESTIADERVGDSTVDDRRRMSLSSNNVRDRRPRSRDRAVVTFDEVEGVRTAFSKMAASIQWFLLYLPGDVVKDLMAAKRTARDARLMEERELTVIFADIRNFTSATAHLRGQVDTYVELLQMYFEHTSNALTDEGCTIDKYIGDCIMGFWGAPLECVDQAERACTGALRLASVVETIAPRFEVHGWELGVRVGVHSGPAMVGSVGSRRRLNYTALGETVNMASRLEGLCNFTHSTILVSEATAVRARMTVDDGTDDLPFVFRRRGLFVLKGASVPMAVYDLTGLTPAAFDAFQQRVGGGVQSADTSQDKSQTLSVTSVGNPSGQASRSESIHHSEHDGKSSFHDHRSRARSVAGTNQTGNHTSRSSQRRARSTLRGLVRHFRVPYDVVTRVDAINHVMVSYDNSQLDDALMQLDNLLRDRDLFASELNRALPESNVLALQLNRVTHDEVVALRDAIAKLLASSAPFDPVTVMTNKS